MTELADTFDAAFSKAVDLGNRIEAEWWRGAGDSLTIIATVRPAD